MGGNGADEFDPQKARNSRVGGTLSRLANVVMLVAEAPQTLTLKMNRDCAAWWRSPWLRRCLLLLPTILVVAGVANVFGQRPGSAEVTTAQARLTVTAPTDARSGLIYAARFRVDAIRDLKKARLVLDSGWADGYTVNGEAPQPLTQGSSDGRLNYGFGHIPAGHHITFWLSLQINPTTVGHHAQSVQLYDGTRLIATINRSVSIFP